MRPQLRRWITLGVLSAYLANLFILTLAVFYQSHAPRNFVPFQTIVDDLHRGGFPFVVNILGNLAVFAPMGVFAPLLLQRCNAWRVAAVSFGLSLVIEVAQGVSGRRVADVDDLILNTLGGLIGYGLFLVATRRFVAQNA